MADVTFTEGTGKIKREEFKLFANVGTAEAPVWELQGRHIEDMSIEMNPNVETVTDVTGVTETTLDKYEPQTNASPYYARRESKMAEWLYNVVREGKTLSDVEKEFLIVNVFSAGSTAPTAYDAWTQTAVVAVQSFGGDTKGVQMPYNIHWTGKKTFGTATITGGTVTFTPAT